jgi:hypothetical protein
MRALWNKGPMGKVAIIGGALIGFLVLCCVVGALVGQRTSQQTADVFATIEAGLATPVAVATRAPEPTATPEPTVSLPPPRPSGEVSRAEFGDTWPLSVESGVLRCLEGRLVVFDADDGKTYAVNGTASGTKRWPEIRELSVPGEIEGMIKDLTPLLDRGLALC